MKTRTSRGGPRGGQARLNRLYKRYEHATLYGTITEMQRAAAAYHTARRRMMGLPATKRRARHLAMR